MLRSGIRDNDSRGSAHDFLLETLVPGSTLRIVSAYFSIHAFHSLKTHLAEVDGLKFLFGEPHFTSESLGREHRQFRIELADEDVALGVRLKDRAIAQDCANWLEEKAEIRSIIDRLLHGKLYHVDDGKRDHAMVGSSNFTLNGLGIHKSSNFELNLLVDGDRDREDLRNWFEEIWSNEEVAVDVKATIIRELRKLFANHSPEFVYFKTLEQLFAASDEERSALENFENSAITNSKIWNQLYDFQRDGAKAAVQKLEAFNGCIIADSVGLGKTYTALAVVKYYELKNKSVLVLCPKKLRENWTVYLAQNQSLLNPFQQDRFSYTVLSHTDLSRENGQVDGVNLATINWGNYDLIVIDESHNFRNNSKGKHDEFGNLVRKSRYERLMTDIIKSGSKTSVLLLSATPVNNDLKDLRNQIYFITEDSDGAFVESLGVHSLKDLIASAQKTFSDWAKKSVDRDTATLMDRLPPGLFRLLDGLSIARSRQHIKKYYQTSLDGLGTFPKRLKPISIFSPIDIKDQFLSYDRLNEQISEYKLSVFNPSRFLKEEFADRYDDKIIQNFTQSTRETFLIGMMKVNYLKRLESSVHSFSISIQRTISRIEDLEKALKNYLAQADGAEIDLESMQREFDFLGDEEDPSPSEVGGAKKFSLEHLNVDEWLEALHEDRRNLNEIRLHAKDVTPDRDAKLLRLKKLVEEKAKHPTTNQNGEDNRKVVVFTAFADTAAYLYEQISKWARENLHIETALVTGGTSGCRTTLGKARYDEILINFAPRAKNRGGIRGALQEGEIDILIATDCISEGQNLQDCDYLINYDIHWNPVRIIQRFGRIDRIGSLNDAIQLINFWPTEDLNKYINLKNRVEARMALVDLSATNADNILDVEVATALVTDDMKYRDKQLLRLKDEIVDLEDFSESLVLSDFTLEDFRRELDNFAQKRDKELEATPTGIFGIVPPNPAYPFIEPGVIFCLRDKKNRAGGDEVNPLQPFYLTFVKDNGEIAHGFAQAKQILDIFRALCLGQTEPYEELCAMFDTETNQGQNMEAYSSLLSATLKSITSQYSRRNMSNLLSERGAKLAEEPQDERIQSEFDLVTWLIVKEGEEYRNA